MTEDTEREKPTQGQKQSSIPGGSSLELDATSHPKVHPKEAKKASSAHEEQGPHASRSKVQNHQHNDVASNGQSVKEAQQSLPVKGKTKPELATNANGPSKAAAKAASTAKVGAWVPQLRPKAEKKVVLAPQSSPVSPGPSLEVREKSTPNSQGKSKGVPWSEVEDDDWDEPHPPVLTQLQQDNVPANEQSQLTGPDSRDDSYLVNSSGRQAKVMAAPKGQGTIHEEQESQESEEFYLNTCRYCGETWLLSVELGEDFSCEEAGKSCGSAASRAAAASFSLEGPSVEDVDREAEASTLRSTLLRRVVAEGLMTLDAADLFLSKGLEAPKPGELEACKAELKQLSVDRAKAKKEEAVREVERGKRKKQQRYLNGEVVEVQKGSKYLVEKKESAEDRQKTSCSLVIIGSHTHGSSKPSEKKGPRS